MPVARPLPSLRRHPRTLVPRRAFPVPFRPLVSTRSRLPVPPHPLRPIPSPHPRKQPQRRHADFAMHPHRSSPTPQKIRPGYLSPARTPAGGPGWRAIAPPLPPANLRDRTPGHDSPHRPGNIPSTRAPLPAHTTPRSGRRQPGSAPYPAQPKSAPPRLKSFLEKTLTRTNPPQFATQAAPPTPRPAPPHRPLADRPWPTAPWLRAQPR